MSDVQQPHQQILPGFQAVGVETLPEGASNLTKKEMAFVLEMLRNPGNQAKAARAAGSTATGNALYVEGSRLLRTAKVQHFLRKCLNPLIESGNELVKDTYQRHQAQQASYMEAEREATRAKEALDKHIEEYGSISRLRGELHLHPIEVKRAKEALINERIEITDHWKMLRKHADTAAQLSNQTGTILASMLGKLQLTLNEGTRADGAVPQGYNDEFAEARRKFMEDLEARGKEQHNVAA